MTNKIISKHEEESDSSILNNPETVYIAAHPFFAEIEEKIATIKPKLLLATMKCLLPFGMVGETYFIKLIKEKPAFSGELTDLYKKMNLNNLECRANVPTYARLRVLGYEGTTMGGSNPVEEIYETGHFIKDNNMNLSYKQ